MVEQQKIFLHVEGELEARIFALTVEGDEAIEEAILVETGLEPGEGSVLIFIEDDEEPIERHSHHGRFHHRTHVHAHRCRRIAVSVRYGGQTKTEAFAPSATMARVWAWAVGKTGFDISLIDAAKLALAQGDQLISPESRVGQYAKHPNCSVTVDLVNKDRFQG